jgi:hypothetical protein
MLVIRDEQLKILGDDAIERWIVLYLTECYTQKVRGMAAAELRKLVQRASRRARSREFNSPEEIRKYAHVTFLLGEDFESDSRLGWALEILDDARFATVGSRLRELEDACLQHFEAKQSKA